MKKTKPNTEIETASSLIALITHEGQEPTSKSVPPPKEQQKIEELSSSLKKELSQHLNIPEDEQDNKRKEFNDLFEKVVNSRADTTTSPSQKDMTKSVTVDELNNVFEHLHNLTKLLNLKEQNGNPEEQAWKLAVTFGSFNGAFDYLTSSQKSLHDSCLYALPHDVAKTKSYEPEIWTNLKKWQSFARQHMTKQVFKTMFANAIQIETLIASEAKKAFNTAKQTQANVKFGEARNGQNEEIEKIQTQIQEHNNRYGDIKNKRVNPDKYGKPTEDDEHFYDTYSQTLNAFYLSLAEAYNGKKFFDANIEIIKAYYEKLKSEEDKGYTFFLKHGLTKHDYEKFLKLKRVDSARIPDIQIDGATIKEDGYYLRRLNVENKEDAVMAACLGKLSDCCQSLSGEDGEPCAIHGLTSPEGGFYVVCKGDIHHPNIEDPLIAQSWVWRSKDDALVIDSIESGSIRNNAEVIAQSFYIELARQLVTEKYDIKKISYGFRSGISRILDFFNDDAKEIPIDYTGYRDSNSQHILKIPDPNLLKDNEIDSLLMRAIEKNNLSIIEYLLKNGASDKQALELISVDPKMFKYLPDSLKEDKYFITTLMRSHHGYEEEIEKLSIEELYLELITQHPRIENPSDFLFAPDILNNWSKNISIPMKYLENSNFASKALKRSPLYIYMLPDDLQSDLTFLHNILNHGASINWEYGLRSGERTATYIFVNIDNPQERLAMIDIAKNLENERLFIKHLIRYGTSVANFASWDIKTDESIKSIVAIYDKNYDCLFNIRNNIRIRNDDQLLADDHRTSYLQKHKQDIVNIINEHNELFLYLPESLQQDPDILNIFAMTIANDLSKVDDTPEKIKSDEASLSKPYSSNQELSDNPIEKVYIHLLEKQLITIDCLPESITRDKHKACMFIKAKYPDLKNLLTPEVKFPDAISVYWVALRSS